MKLYFVRFLIYLFVRPIRKSLLTDLPGIVVVEPNSPSLGYGNTFVSGIIDAKTPQQALQTLQTLVKDYYGSQVITICQGDAWSYNHKTARRLAERSLAGVNLHPCSTL